LHNVGSPPTEKEEKLMRLFRSFVPVFLFLVALPLAAQTLEIHYIDVGWGGSVFIKGPTGITVLMEAGNTDRTASSSSGKITMQR
jgi:hypothetical protein